MALAQLHKRDSHRQQIQEQLLYFKNKLPASVDNVSILTTAQNLYVSSFIDWLPTDILLEILSFLELENVIVAGRLVFFH